MCCLVPEHRVPKRNHLRPMICVGLRKNSSAKAVRE
jgi:hypothetical protein